MSNKHNTKIVVPKTSKRSISVTHPEIAAQWDYDTNNPALPEQVTAGSSRKFWWICKIGHGWEAQVGHRTKGSGCPYCAGKKVLAGFNDLMTTNPELATQWSAKNDISADTVSRGSDKKVWWECEFGHEWQTKVLSRAVSGNGCNYCAGKEAIKGVNDLLTVNPKLAAEMDNGLNTISSNEILPHSNKYIWWKCEKSHTWKAQANARSRGDGCPYCSGLKSIEGETDFLTIYPELAKQWSPKNKKGPHEYTYRSNKAVTWVCKYSHEWEARVAARATGQGCPYCAGKKVKAGFNDIKSQSPSLASQWSSENTLEPDMVTSMSGYRAKWICLKNKNHKWEAKVSDRSTYSTGCPKCANGKGTSQPEKDLADFIDNLYPKQVLTNVKTLIPPFEVDIYIPDANIAIEFNGLYWHSEEAGKDREYHYNKWKMCRNKGVQLITVWEDDWRDRNDLIKRTLSHKLGISDQDRVFARKTKFTEIPNNIAKDFLEKNHIQGYKNISRNFGLISKTGEVLSVASITMSKGVLTLDRYATSCIVVGGMGKILKGLVKHLDPEVIETFADHEISNGGLYELLGFEKSYEIAPDYKYVADKTQREHKSNYRLKKFKEDPNLIFEEGKTESELAQLNKFYKIWDSGKTKFEYRRVN